MVFQNPYSSLNPRKKVRSALAKPFKVHGEKYSDNTLDELLAKVELIPSSNYLDKYPHQLSGGQRQRVSIARSLSLGPRVLVLDEPTSALDVTTKTQILDLLRKLQHEEHLTLVFITHELPFLRFVSDRISVMYNGRIVEKGKSRDIFENAYHPYTIGLLNSILEIDPQRAREKGGLFSGGGNTIFYHSSPGMQIPSALPVDGKNVQTGRSSHDVDFKGSPGCLPCILGTV